MSRERHINVYHEIEVTDLPNKDVISWCESNTRHGWNIIADSGPQSARFDGRHYVMLLFTHLEDLVMFKMVWY